MIKLTERQKKRERKIEPDKHKKDGYWVEVQRHKQTDRKRETKKEPR